MIYIIESFSGVKVNPPHSSYYEEAKIGRYTVHAIFLPGGGYYFYIFKGDDLKAILSDKEWYISRMDGEGQNLLNRLLKIYG